MLEKVFFEYKNKTLRNLHELREFVHKQYKYKTNDTKTDYNRQQDVTEFLSHLYFKSDLLQNTISFEAETLTTRCNCYEKKF